MRNRRRLIALTFSVAAIATATVAVASYRAASRRCDLPRAGQEELASEINSSMEQAMAAALGEESLKRIPVVTLPGDKRDFGLDQGPQRVCASGATLTDSYVGPVNVILRVYDSSAAAEHGAYSNLAAAIARSDRDGQDVLASSSCTHWLGQVCQEFGAQSVVGRTSVVILSRYAGDKDVRTLAVNLSLELDTALR